MDEENGRSAYSIAAGIKKTKTRILQILRWPAGKDSERSGVSWIKCKEVKTRRNRKIDNKIREFVGPDEKEIIFIKERAYLTAWSRRINHPKQDPRVAGQSFWRERSSWKDKGKIKWR